MMIGIVIDCLMMVWNDFFVVLIMILDVVFGVLEVLEVFVVCL